ncbi:hypothetical protein [Streptomyces sp. SM12]|uniref:deoxynucleotide monophosphate kinase family protein n=1 Tax=Streptomyces sp. SM12 TaxID=1071602 RepID=UPI000CD5BD7B|nr:hypothetical protein [Streptomyces sp. SM12]
MHIGLMGPAGAGKDTAAGMYFTPRGYRRVAFADMLRMELVGLNPAVPLPSGVSVPLTVLLDLWSWNRAKRNVPAVRELLQSHGELRRAEDPRYWIRPVEEQFERANETGVPLVVTDVRTPDEVALVRKYGGRLIYISRHIQRLVHTTETMVSAADADVEVENHGSVAELCTALNLAYGHLRS